MSDENGKVVARGWYLGLGLIVPITIATVAGGYLNNYVYRLWQKSHPDEFDYLPTRADLAKDIVVESFHDVRNGKKVMILGVVANKGKDTVTSTTVEAEFFNDKGEFVYEKSTYIRKRLKPDDRENFQITCGCGDEDFPAYAKVTVRIVEANNY